MANPNVVVMGHHFTFNITKNAGLALRFENLLDEIGKLKQSDKHDIKVSPLNSSQVVSIDFVENFVDQDGNVRVSGTISRAKMRLDNYYMIAYQREFNPESTVYELKDVPGFHALRGSELLEERVKYPNELTGWLMGYKGFRTAVYNLRDGVNVGDSLITLALFISESVRFRWMSSETRRQFKSKNLNITWKLEQWMRDMIHDWQPLSDLARKYKENGTLIDPSKLPLTPTRQDKKVKKKYGADIFKHNILKERAAAVCVLKLLPPKDKE